MPTSHCQVRTFVDSTVVTDLSLVCAQDFTPPMCPAYMNNQIIDSLGQPYVPILRVCF